MSNSSIFVNFLNCFLFPILSNFAILKQKITLPDFSIFPRAINRKIFQSCFDTLFPKSRIQKKFGKWIYVWNIFLILINSAFDNSSNPRPNWTIPRRKMVDTIPSSFSVKIWGWGVLCTLLSQAKQRSSRSKKELHLGLSRPLYTMMKTNRSLLLQSNALRERASIFKLLQFALKL